MRLELYWHDTKILIWILLKIPFQRTNQYYQWITIFMQIQI